MFDHRILTELIREQQLLKDTNFELKKKQSLNKLLFLSLDQTNDHLQNLFSHLLQRQNRLLNYFIEENERQVQRQTLVNLLQQVLSNENLLMNKLRRIHLKLTVKSKKHRTTPREYSGDDSILTVYWRVKSLQSLAIRTNSSDTCLKTNTNKFSFVNSLSLTNIQWNFPKLEHIKRHIL